MYIETCPKCGYTPKIEELCRDDKGRRRWVIGCRNYCDVIKYPNSTNGFEMKRGIVYTGSADRNTLYKLWNEAIKENNNAQV